MSAPSFRGRHLCVLCNQVIDFDSPDIEILVVGVGRKRTVRDRKTGHIHVCSPKEHEKDQGGRRPANQFKEKL